ncbi:MAG: hypothetical protein AB1760_00335 [Pseudomonadota bacterium]
MPKQVTLTDAELAIHGKARARKLLTRADVAEFLALHGDKKKHEKRDRIEAWLSAYYDTPEGREDMARPRPAGDRFLHAGAAVQHVLDSLDSYPEYHKEP